MSSNRYYHSDRDWHDVRSAFIPIHGKQAPEPKTLVMLQEDTRLDANGDCVWCGHIFGILGYTVHSWYDSQNRTVWCHKATNKQLASRVLRVV